MTGDRGTDAANKGRYRGLETEKRETDIAQDREERVILDKKTWEGKTDW